MAADFGVEGVAFLAPFVEDLETRQIRP